MKYRVPMANQNEGSMSRKGSGPQRWSGNPQGRLQTTAAPGNRPSNAVFLNADVRRINGILFLCDSSRSSLSLQP